MDFLPEWYFYQRDPGGVDSAIFLDLARRFIEETPPLRKGGTHLLLVMEGYSYCGQIEVLRLLRKHGIIAIRLPDHTYHVLQPLKFSVYSSFKAHSGQEFFRMSRTKKTMDSFDLSALMSAAYNSSATYSNIQS